MMKQSPHAKYVFDMSETNKTSKVTFPENRFCRDSSVIKQKIPKS